MVDEFDLRALAKDLAGLYRELDAAKFAQAKPPEIRTMRPAPGPRPPAPDHVMSLDEELCSRLFEMVRECANHVQPTLVLHHHGQRLAAWVAFNAQPVSELDVAPDLVDEMQDQVGKLKRTLQPRGVDEVAKRAEPRHISGIIIGRLSNQGHKVTREQLRQWASRGHITSQVRDDGRATYLMTEVIDWINREPETL